MSNAADTPKRPRILYSCYASRSRDGEQFVAEHLLSYQVAGTLLTHDGQQELLSQPGDLRLSTRNRLVKFTKQPPAHGEYQSLSIAFDQETLRHFSRAHGYRAEKQPPGPALVALPNNALITSYLNSLQPYEQLAQAGNEALLTLKMQEALLLLLSANPALKNVLFDFTEPGKIDLAAFMEQNFRFNVAVSRFAYLTGRSLATFKRDFERLFQLSPSRWLLRRRLQEAHYLLTAQGKAPSEVYLEVGFEDLSHFSFAFKKAYGLAPSRL